MEPEVVWEIVMLVAPVESVEMLSVVGGAPALVAVGVGVAVGVDVAVLVAVGVGVAVGEAVAVLVGVGVAVGVDVAVLVAVGVGVAVAGGATYSSAPISGVDGSRASSSMSAVMGRLGSASRSAP